MALTNRKVIKLWDNLLESVVGCYADENGNRPCDLGKKCRMCEGYDLSGRFSTILEHAAIEEDMREHENAYTEDL